MATTQNHTDSNLFSAAWLRANEASISEALQKGFNPLTYFQMKPIFDLIGQYETASQETNTANQQRYQQGLSLLSNMEKMYAGYHPQPQPVDTHTYGQAARQRIDTAQKQNTATATQNLVSSGLFNTTMPTAVASRFQADATQQHLELDDALARYRQEQLDKVYAQQREIAQERLTNLANAQMQKLDWIYKKVDSPPDMNMLSSQLQLMTKYPGWFAGIPQSQQDWWRQRIAAAKTGT